MAFLVTGSAGHLGEGLMRTLRAAGEAVVGIDSKPSPFTDHVGSIADRVFVRRHVHGTSVVLHAAALHKPHVATHARQDFVDTNVSGTLNLLEESVTAGVGRFVFTSTTSVFGDALTPAEREPAAWITEDVVPIPKNIYGVTKLAAENLCQLFHRNQGLPCIVLRTSRFFPEDDDSKSVREAFDSGNAKANEFLYRRADIADVVEAHLLAAGRAAEIGFGKYIVSATTPFRPEDAAELGRDAPAVLARRVAAYVAAYAKLGWRMFPAIDRVYDNGRARQDLGWRPRHEFAQVIESLNAGRDFNSLLAREVGTKGYHDRVFAEGPYPVD